MSPEQHLTETQAVMSDNSNPTLDSAPIAPEPSPSGGASTQTPRRKWLTPALALVAVLVIGLFGGVLIAHATAASPQAIAPGGFIRGQNGAGGGAAGGGFTTGTITSINGTTMVVTAQDGTQKTVTTTSTTKVTSTSLSSISSLKTGQPVTVIGPIGSNGDVTATTVSEGASLRGLGGRNGGPSGGATGGATPATPGSNG